MQRLSEVKRTFLFFVINPTSAYYYYWTALLSVGCFYNLMMVVIFIFDDIPKLYFTQWLLGNVFFDAVFVLDIFVQSRVAYLEDGAIVSNVRVLAKRYFRNGTFWIDIIAVLPTDLFLIMRKEISLLRLNRLIKCYHIPRFVERTEMRTHYPNGFRIFWLVITCVVLFHWNACAYFLISLGGDINSPDTNVWIFTYTKIADLVIPMCDVSLADHHGTCGFNETDRNVTLRSQYVDEMMEYWKGKFTTFHFSNFSKEYSLSFYWSALTMTTCGQQPYPQSSIQNALEIVDTLIGLLVFAIIIGSVGNVVSTMNTDQSEFQDQLDGIKFYMNYRLVNQEIQTRVLNCCEYSHAQGMMKDEKVILDVLPRRLQSQIAAELHMETLQRVELLRDCEVGLIYELVQHLHFQMFGPNDYVCRRGELAKEMFIVKRGQLNCVSDDGLEVIEVLKEGSVFGQLSILNLSGKSNANKHTVAVRSFGYTDVYVLRQDDVADVLRDYPESKKMLIGRGNEILSLVS
ncbi:hypothetical protein AB6A40_000573 [Gnathostoma spinigerum]|uniref:Cyclic nucleotide-binding domain-containing protein n=1 Tax=Gnathostoma spinigerum TaxID=75299 RepID=A0ABD6E919_9BILA